MSTSEVGLLALGVLAGIAAAGGLIRRARFGGRSRPSVRLTISPGTVTSGTASTLSAMPASWAPASGGPADPRNLHPEPRPAPGEARAQGVPNAAASSGPRTDVRDREPVGVPVEGEQAIDFRTLLGRPASAAPSEGRSDDQSVAVPVPARGGGAGGDVRAGSREVGRATGAHGDIQSGDSMENVIPRSQGGGPRPEESGAGADAPAAPPPGSAAGGPAPGAAPASVPETAIGEPGRDAGSTPAPDSAPGLEAARAAVLERAAIADRLKVTAVGAAERLRSEQRAYDACQAQIRQAEADLDGRTIRAAKEAAQRAFRAARAAARTQEDIETAASAWLRRIDTINHAARIAASGLTRDRQAAARLTSRLERLAVEADAARINAEAAAEACLIARQRLAALEQGDEPEEAGSGTPVRAATVRLVPLDPGAPAPAIVRLLRGDHGVLVDVVAQLGGPDPEEQRRWQLQLAGLVDGLVARALESAWLEFPADHPFWGMFSPQQDRDIAHSLASLGFRFDGLGGFVDARVPSQRELSLALGYAGLDPMRIRRWPDPAGMAALYREVRVDVVAFASVEAPTLSLGELVTLLGPRAEQLTELWNSWGRVRPLLLAAG